MKLVIQIPCYNEAETLPLVLKEIPSSIPGVTQIQVLVIDDGSTDDTQIVARSNGVTEVLRNTRNLGLAFSFRRGLDRALALGANIIVNIDGDNQYNPRDIPKLIQPILDHKADIVLGNRSPSHNIEFSRAKRWLQWLGSWIVRRLSGMAVEDAVTGFRAFSREAALKLTILSGFTYTIESILQAAPKGLAISEVSIRTNPATRQSRLASSIWSFVSFSAATILRIFAMYNPLRIFIITGSTCIALGLIGTGRFLLYYFMHGGAGHVQSLVLSGVLLMAGLIIILVGVLADLIQFNRRLLEDILERLKRIEFNDATK